MLTVLRHGTFPITDKGGLTFPDHASRCFVATGRSALYHLAQKLDCPRVLLPGFVPEGVLFPFVAAGKRIEFYRITSDLMPDFSDIAALLTDGPSALVVVIHYFGQIADTPEILIETHAHGGYVLEDCAHALLHKPKLADFMLYSLNKFLPVPDGAILLSRRPEVHLQTYGGACPPPRGVVPTDALVAYANHLRANAEIARRKPEDGRDDALRSHAAYQRYYDLMGHDMTLYSPSPMARLGLMADPEKINPRPWRAHRVRSDAEGQEVAWQLWKRGVYASDARDHWHIPSGHMDQNFILVPPGTDEIVSAAFEAVAKGAA